MVQIALWPGNVMNTLRSLFKERYTGVANRCFADILCISNCVQKCSTGKKAKCNAHRLRDCERCLAECVICNVWAQQSTNIRNPISWEPISLIQVAVMKSQWVWPVPDSSLSLKCPSHDNSSLIHHLINERTRHGYVWKRVQLPIYALLIN